MGRTCDDGTSSVLFYIESFLSKNAGPSPLTPLAALGHFDSRAVINRNTDVTAATPRARIAFAMFQNANKTTASAETSATRVPGTRPALALTLFVIRAAA